MGGTVMTVQLELETYRHLVLYLRGAVSLRDFRRWFDSHTWDQTQWESPLIGQIELALAELSSSHLTEQEFVEVLRSSIPTLTLEMQPITQSNLPTVVISTASNVTKSLSAFVVPNSRRSEGSYDEHPMTFLPWRPASLRP
jgi:hypothetical protein